jgi:2-methylcitrate dehydratase
MTDAERLAAFVFGSRYEDLSDNARLQLKMRILDAVGCAIGTLGSSIASQLRDHTREFGAERQCTLVGGQRSAPDRVAFFNGAFVRYLDFNDSYLARGETCHPSDNVRAMLAACEYAGSGRDFLTALAVAYQVQCRLSDVAPVRALGFDHPTQGSYAVAAGVAKTLGLIGNELRTLSPSAALHSMPCESAVRVLSPTGRAWYANTAFGCAHATFLAMRGMTGPLKVFEGNRGFIDSIAGRFEIDWAQEGLDRATQTIIKKYNAEIHSQSAIDAALELKRRLGLTGEEVEEVNIEIFDVAFHIIGGGEEGDKQAVRTKEERPTTVCLIWLPWLCWMANVMPAQFSADRICRADVQELFRRSRRHPSVGRKE